MKIVDFNEGRAGGMNFVRENRKEYRANIGAPEKYALRRMFPLLTPPPDSFIVWFSSTNQPAFTSLLQPAVCCQQLIVENYIIYIYIYIYVFRSHSTQQL